MPVRSAIALRRPIVHCAPVGLLLLLARLLDIGGVETQFSVLAAANRRRGARKPRALIRLMVGKWSGRLRIARAALKGVQLGGELEDLIGQSLDVRLLSLKHLFVVPHI